MKCRICQAELPAGAMFCGECGSSTTATPKTRKRPDPRPSDTTIIQPLPPAFISVPVDVSAPVDVSVPVDDSVQVEGSVARDIEAPPERDMTTAGSPAEPSPAEPSPAEPSPAEPSPAAIAAEASISSVVKFVLQFSTGETVAVTGTGLVGRRPLPQPTEYFDHLIQVADVGMSVSKSHLEFGQHDGELWVSDRFSGNGTVVRRSDGTSLRCEPGRRYLVPRGSRVEIADQFFVVT